MPDVEHFNLLLIFQDAIYYTIEMEFMTVGQVPKLVTLSSNRSYSDVVGRVTRRFTVRTTSWAYAEGGAGYGSR